MPTKEELKKLQSDPLPQKVILAKARIREWYYKWDGQVYVSFSGGKDSTVLLHLVRQICPDVKAVFVDTGLEYPEIRSFVKLHNNVTVLRPKMTFKDVICTFGYPVLTKRLARVIGDAQRGTKWALDYVYNTGSRFRNGKKSMWCAEKYKSILQCDFRVSSRCCDVMKKAPLSSLNLYPFTAQMACESQQRQLNWIKFGCNLFEAKHPVSNPLSFWTEQDIFQYIKKYDLDICSVYGDVIPENGQLVFNGMPCRYCTTGCSRTGCIFCGFSAHLERYETRFQLLKKTHPKLYDYCIGGGAYDPEDGLWKPDKNGLGMAHVFDELNKLYGEDFIRYK